MSARETEEERAALGLPRLPPGRHGLARDFVVKNQRDRLTAGIISVVARRGYHESSVSRICEAAGVSRRTFYSYFPSKEECFLHAYDLVVEHLTTALAEAGADEAEWPLRVRARLEAMLAIFAANPDLVHFTITAPLRAGSEIAARHRLALEQVLQVLSEDLPTTGQARRPPPAVEEALVGGMMAVIARKVERGDGQPLRDLLPELVELYLIPYVGWADAARAAEPEHG